jgi:hypothetical protein
MKAFEDQPEGASGALTRWCGLKNGGRSDEAEHSQPARPERDRQDFQNGGKGQKCSQNFLS